MKKDKKLKNLVKKYFNECIINGKLSEAKVLKLSLALKKLPKLQAIQAVSFLLGELKAYENKTTLTVEAAAPLSSEMLKKITNTFKPTYDIRHTTYQNNPSLLGGVKVRIGDVLFDNSVVGKLQQVKEVIANG